MKKRLLSILLISSLTIMSLVACGASDDSGKEGEKKQDAIVEESGESTGSDSAEDLPGATSVTGDGVKVEGPDEDDGIIEVEGEVTVDVIPDDGIDWSVKYDDYFTRDNIMPANTQVAITTVGENVTIPYGVVAVAGEDAYMSYDFGTAAIDMYVFADKVYTFTRMEDQEMWCWAPVTTEDETPGLVDMADTSLVDEEDMSDCTYREAIIDDGIIYDVLDVTVVDETRALGTATYFINRETQLIEKCVMEAEDATAVCLVEEIESIELPAEADTATEVTMEDIMGALVGVMLIGSGAAAE